MPDGAAHVPDRYGANPDGGRLYLPERLLSRHTMQGVSLALPLLQGQGQPKDDQGHAYKRKACELLTSEEGIKERGRRCIEPEAVFGQMKSNMAYRRFRHMGKDKGVMDFTFFAIAFNIKKLCSMMRKVDKKGRKTSSYGKFVVIFICYMHKLEICQDKFEKMTA